MPANLTPQYQKAEEAYRRAQTPAEQVACLEEMLTLIPKHKGTEKLQADLKTRLKEARAETEAEKKAPKKGRSYRFPRQGAGQVVLLGGPNAGKSRVLAELTAAEPTVAEYPFSTHEPMPGMMSWEDVTVQLIDTPPVTESHFEPYILNIVRGADAVLLCLNGSSDDAPDETLAVVEQLRSRKTLLSRTTGFDEDDFSIVHVKTLLVVTRADGPGVSDRLDYFREMLRGLAPFRRGSETGPDPVLDEVLIELDREDARESLRNRIYEMLDVIRVYTKAPGKPADYVDPFTVPRGGTVEDVALKVHRDLAASLKYAKVWGDSARDGQSVGREHVLADRDLVELH